MHAVVLLCPYSDSQSSELLSSDTSNPQHKTAHPHHHCLSTPSLPMTARKMIHSIPGPYSKSIIPPGITASAANACGFLLTPESKAPRRSTVASLGIAREALPISASGKPPRARRSNWHAGRAFSSYLHSTRLSCEAMICHVPPRLSHVSVQTWHTFALGWDLSLPTACSLP
jgi:hypothetical protein